MLNIISIALLQRHALQNIQMIATSGFLTALECTKFVFGQGSASDPAGRAYNAPPDYLPGLRGTLLLREMGGKGMDPPVLLSAVEIALSHTL